MWLAPPPLLVPAPFELLSVRASIFFFLFVNRRRIYIDDIVFFCASSWTVLPAFFVFLVKPNCQFSDCCSGCRFFFWFFKEKTLAPIYWPSSFVVMTWSSILDSFFFFKFHFEIPAFNYTPRYRCFFFFIDSSFPPDVGKWGRLTYYVCAIIPLFLSFSPSPSFFPCVSN